MEAYSNCGLMRVLYAVDFSSCLCGLMFLLRKPNVPTIVTPGLLEINGGLEHRYSSRFRGRVVSALDYEAGDLGSILVSVGTID